MLGVLVKLPLARQQALMTYRLGPDLTYWGLVAKFALELLARELFMPGLRPDDDKVRAVWFPVLSAPKDLSRFRLLAEGMPPACRAIIRERGGMSDLIAPNARMVLQDFFEHLIDSVVREWAQLSSRGLYLTDRVAVQSTKMAPVTRAWWKALWSLQNTIDLPPTKRRDLARFYQDWRGWAQRARPETSVAFRICFRLDPPEFDSDRGRVGSSDWTLRYFLQDIDDPSLLVPAREVWRERGDALSYLNRRFDHPQEKLLERLGTAARLCPAIRRSLNTGAPEATSLTAQEAFSFMRETAKLLEGVGFSVMVPPWWNTPDTRLQVKTRLRVASSDAGSPVLSMDALLAYDWELALGDEPLTREEFEQLAALKAPLVQIRGRWVMLQPDQVEAAIAFWERHRELSTMRVADALNLALGVKKELDGLSVSTVELDEQLTDILAPLTHTTKLEVHEAPQGFVGQLRPYQTRGFSWLAFLRRYGFGACLADDMGLGKTIQAIALILHERAKDPNIAPALIICPTSLVGNWRREIERFAPDLRILVHHGSQRAEGNTFIEQSLESDVVISTYGLVRRDIEDLIRVRWSNIILDEAQNIKNPLTKQARAVRRLKGDGRIVLTGTPIENRLSDLWSIMSFLNPRYLGSQESFRRAFSLPIERYQDQEASQQLRKLVQPFILRRLKTDPHVIQDLPEKFEYKVYCNLTREQATLYEAIVRDALAVLSDREGRERSIKRRGQVLAMLTRLKQVCDHPTLFLKDGSLTASRSGKLNRLCAMLEEILEIEDRALIFTQFAQMGHLLQRHLQERFGREVLFLYGGTSQKQRDRMLTRFQTDPYAPSIFILSLKAGGTGLNLMRANHVFHFDRWWNPAVEDQATDRAYRIGQTRDVQVHKFVCLGTLEERIDMLIESKRALAENVVGAGEAWLTELSTDQLREIVSLRAEAVETE
jgi:SNF2 family DNA or RNA helicase